MTIVIKKGQGLPEIEVAKKRIQKKQPSLANFYGKLKGTFGDGLDYQKKVRNEWD